MVLGDNEAIEKDNLVVPNVAVYKKGIPWSEDRSRVDWNDAFFSIFFPCLDGHAALINKYLSDECCEYHTTATYDNIKFHRDKYEGHGVLVKVFYTLMIIAVLESETGVDNLWKKGPSDGLRDYADFGQYIPKNYFKCFQAAAPFM